jgi:ribosomal protein L2
MFFLSKTYATGVNTFGKKISSGVRLPSGNQLKRVGSFIAANFSKKQTALLGKKSSTFFFKKKRISVRGVAKNSVDHKHGGKGRGGVLRNF